MRRILPFITQHAEHEHAPLSVQWKLKRLLQQYAARFAFSKNEKIKKHIYTLYYNKKTLPHKTAIR